MRERAQQSCPALPNTATGAAAAAALEVGVGEHDVGRLAAQLERHPLDRRRGARRRCRGPTSVEPVKAIFATSGCSTSRCPQTLPGPGDDVQHALRQAGLERDPLQLERGQRRQLGRLQHDRVARRQRRRDLPRRDHEREVPRHDQADDPERLAERHVDAAGDRDRVAEQALRRAGVVAERVDHHPHLAAGVGDRLAGVARLERREIARRASSSASARRWSSAARSAGATARHGRNARLRRGRPRHRPPRRRRAAPRAITCSVAGSMTSIIGADTPASRRLDQRGDHPAARRPARGATGRRARTGWPGSSIASTTSSSVDQPVATSPSPSRSESLVVVRLDRDPLRARRARRQRARLEPHLVVAEGAGRVAVVRRGRRRRAGAGRASRRARRSASACRGRSRAPACRARAPRA